jgi:hypothetical protein
MSDQELLLHFARIQSTVLVTSATSFFPAIYKI